MFTNIVLIVKFHNSINLKIKIFNIFINLIFIQRLKHVGFLLEVLVNNIPKNSGLEILLLYFIRQYIVYNQ